MRRILVAASLLLVISACSSSSHTAAPAKSVSSTTGPPASKTIAAKPSSGCTASTVVKPGQQRVDTTSDGAPRWYIRHVPPGYNGRTPLPLLVDLHAYSEGAEIQTHMSELGPYGDKHHFITITPQGSGVKVSYWNSALNSPDMKFIGHLLDEVDRTLCVDDQRVFADGMSDGAFMASAVARAYADRVGAVATVAGLRDPDGCKPARAVPVVAFHGTKDPFVSYTGGLGPSAAALPVDDNSGRKLGDILATPRPDPRAVRSVPVLSAAWAKRNGCTSATAQSKQIATDITLMTWPCPTGDEVELYRVNGGGHAWPSSNFSKAIASVVGRTTFSINADDIIWEFFRAHPLPSG